MATITVLTLVLLVVTVVVIQTIQRAPVAGQGAPGGPAGGTPAMPPAAVYVTTVAEETTEDEAVVTGTLRALSRADIAAREPGAIEAVLVDEGQEVKAGAVLAKLDRRRIDSLLSEAKAALTSAESLVRQRAAELSRTAKDLEMKRALRERNAVSQSDLLDAQKAVTVAQVQQRVAEEGVTEAQSRVEFLQIQSADLSVKAPFDGVVIARHVEPGEWVGAGATVVSLVKTDPVEAWLRVPARYLTGPFSERDGFRVRRSSTGELFSPGKVAVIPDVDGRSQLFTLVATIPNPDRKLVPGESVTGIVPVGQRQAYWRVPVNAVVQSPMGTIVQVVQPPADEGTLPTARGVPVQVAFEREGDAYVGAASGAFKAGDQVVVEGNERLMPGQSLMIQPAKETPAPQAP